MGPVLSTLGRAAGEAALAELPGLTHVVFDRIAALVHREAPIQQASSQPDTVKLANVATAATADLHAAVSAGEIAAVPPPAIVATAVQSIVSSMKVAGELPKSSAPSAAMPVSIITCLDDIVSAMDAIRKVVGDLQSLNLLQK